MQVREGDVLLCACGCNEGRGTDVIVVTPENHGIIGVWGHNVGKWFRTTMDMSALRLVPHPEADRVLAEFTAAQLLGDVM